MGDREGVNGIEARNVRKGELQAAVQMAEEHMQQSGVRLLKQALGRLERNSLISLLLVWHEKAQLFAKPLSEKYSQLKKRMLRVQEAAGTYKMRTTLSYWVTLPLQRLLLIWKLRAFESDKALAACHTRHACMMCCS